MIILLMEVREAVGWERQEVLEMDPLVLKDRPKRRDSSPFLLWYIHYIIFRNYYNIVF